MAANEEGKGTGGGEEQVSHNRQIVGRILYYAGISGVAIGAGMAIGFFAADRGVRWLPTMLEILLGVSIVSLFVIIAGTMMEGRATRLTPKGLRVRKRVIFCIGLTAVAIVANLWGRWTQKPCALTKLTEEEFEGVYQTDCENYGQYSKGIENQLSRVQVLFAGMGTESDHVLTSREERTLRDIWMSIYDYAFAMDQIRMFYEDWFRFDPSRVQRSRHVRSFLLTYAAEVSLYEKSLRFVGTVTEKSNAVKFLNAPYGELAEADSFSRFRQDLTGGNSHTRVLAGREYLRIADKGLQGRSVTMGLDCDRLWDDIDTELGILDQTGFAERTTVASGSDLEVLRRNVRHAWFTGQKGVAIWMSNTKVRRVGQYLIEEDQLEDVDSKLEPGDIMFSRKNWYMTNVGLPGFWPHAILYIGGPWKLERYFDDESVRSYICGLAGEEINLAEYLVRTYPRKWLRYKAGREGREYRVIEGIRDGIVFNTLVGAGGDYMAGIRPRLSKSAKAKAIIEAFGHVDKPYDYDFDFATDHALVCTELVWRSYRETVDSTGLRMEPVDIGGRKTLPANEIVKLFAGEHGKDDRQFDFVYFLDAVEKEGRAFLSSEEEFLRSPNRVKWSFMLD